MYYFSTKTNPFWESFVFSSKDKAENYLRSQFQKVQIIYQNEELTIYDVDGKEFTLLYCCEDPIP